MPYCDVDQVDDDEADDFPELDLLVEEDDRHVNGGHDIRDNVAVEGQRIDLALAHKRNDARNHGRDEQPSPEIRSHPNVAMSADNGGHQSKDIRTSISKGKERDTCDTRRDSHFLHHVGQGDTKVLVCRCGQNVDYEREHQKPKDN